MNTYKQSKIIKRVLNYNTLQKFEAFASAHAGIKTSVVSAERESSCFTSVDPTYYSRTYLPYITLGEDFYKTMFPTAPTNVDAVHLKDEYNKIARTYYAVFFHEFFHVMYTPMKYSRSILQRLPENFAGIASFISNIFEDETIEFQGTKEFPKSFDLIKELDSYLGNHETLDRLEKCIKDNPKDINTAINFLFVKVRCPQLRLPDYDMYYDNQYFFDTGIQLCVGTPEPELRFRRHIAFTKELLKLYDVNLNEQPDLDNVKNPQVDNVPETQQQADKSVISKGVGQLQSYKDIQDYNSTADNNPQDANDVKDFDPNRSYKAESINKGTNPKGDLECPPLSAVDIKTLANDDPVLPSRYRHELRPFKHSMFNKYNMLITNCINSNRLFITQIIRIIEKMKTYNAMNRYQRHNMTGKLDTKSFYEKDNYKFFKRKLDKSEEADLYFAFLIDNSGSMHYDNKAKVAGEAMICMGEAMNKLHIPFTIDLFTTDGNSCITLQAKGDRESWENCKYSLGVYLTGDNVPNMSNWNANVDEVNLSYLIETLKYNKHKDKCIIVLSDGATCGNYKHLKDVVDSASNYGITVLGVGLMDNNVSESYKNYVVLKGSKDLVKLKDFLAEYLTSKIFKGGK